MPPVEPYNPLDKTNLGKSVADALLSSEVLPLGEIDAFEGSGIYAIYYDGSFHPYQRISRMNGGGKFGQPIYVGKAVPAGARKGVASSRGAGSALASRLREHAESVSLAKNLNISDFHRRCLVVDDVWISLGESLLIARFAPLWNNLVDGFGNHDPGKGRYEGQRSRWDVLHPGRAWAAKCRPRSETAEQIEREIEARLRS